MAERGAAVQPVAVRGLPGVPLPLSHAVRCGDLLFVPATTGRDSRTGAWGDLDAQLEQVLASLEVILAEASCVAALAPRCAPAT